MRASKTVAIGAAVAICALIFGVVFGGTAVAKKKKSGGPISLSTKAAVPLNQATGAGPTLKYGVTNIPFTVTKKAGKGRVVAADSVIFTVSMSGAAGSLTDHSLTLINPKGRPVSLSIPNNPLSTTIGPLVFSPNTIFSTCGTPPCANPDSTVNGPTYVGTISATSLAHFTGTAVRGTWIARFYDTDPTNTAATVSSAKLDITTVKAPAA